MLRPVKSKQETILTNDFTNLSKITHSLRAKKVF